MKLGEYCKKYELQNQQYLLPGLPIYVRIDGKAFHTYTRDMVKPFDATLIEAMRSTTANLVSQWNATLGYCQSDEISLMFLPSEDGFPFFNGRVQKVVSLMASSATAHFANFTRGKLIQPFPEFDCRVWQSTLDYAVKYLIWREDDAIRNSISMLAHSNFNHSELQSVTSHGMKRMLYVEKGIMWEKLPSRLKRGSYYRKKKKTHIFSKEQIDSLPSLHEARKNPDRPVVRSVVVEMNYPRMRSITNLQEVVWLDKDPIQENTEAI